MVRRIIIIIAAVLLVTGAGAVFYFYRLFTTPVSVCEDYRIFITPTDTRQSILAGIMESDPDARTKALDYLLKRRDYDSHIHTGCYTVKSGATPKQVSNMLLSGSQTPVRLTINSVKTL